MKFGINVALTSKDNCFPVVALQIDHGRRISCGSSRALGQSSWHALFNPNSYSGSAFRLRLWQSDEQFGSKDES
jgi:hypothetical protein